MKTGLYFGSFNPIHVGHLIIANHILNEGIIDKLWFVLSPQNPFKENHSLLNEYDRLHLARVATENDPRIKVMDIEFKLPKPSFTVNTLTWLEEKYSGYSFSVIMGGDSFQNLHKWKNYEHIVSHYPIIVYNRPGFDISNHVDAKLTVLDAPLLQISSTQIREYIQQGKSVRYLLTDPVREEIEKSGYYKSR